MTRRGLLASAALVGFAPLSAFAPGVKIEELWSGSLSPQDEVREIWDAPASPCPVEYLCIIDRMNCQWLRGSLPTDMLVKVNGSEVAVPIGEGCPIIYVGGQFQIGAITLRQWCWDRGIPSASPDDFASSCAFSLNDWPEDDDA